MQPGAFPDNTPPVGVNPNQPSPNSRRTTSNNTNNNTDDAADTGDNSQDSGPMALVEANLVAPEPPLGLGPNQVVIDTNALPQAEVVPQEPTFLSKFAPETNTSRFFCLGVLACLAAFVIAASVCGSGMCSANDNASEAVETGPTYSPIGPFGSPAAAPFDDDGATDDSPMDDTDGTDDLGFRTAHPTLRPTLRLTLSPTLRLTLRPTLRPTPQPTPQPTKQPTKQPTLRPTPRPTPQTFPQNRTVQPTFPDYVDDDIPEERPMIPRLMDHAGDDPGDDDYLPQ